MRPQHFLVPTIPDLAALPYGGYISSSEAAQLHSFSTSFRSQALTLAHRSPEYTVTVVDAYGLFEDFYARPKAYSFAANFTHASCLTGAYGEAPRSLCANPDEHVFWDEYHVTPSRSRESAC
jgi:phospholipase/lecithinase/hemolysin